MSEQLSEQEQTELSIQEKKIASSLDNFLCIGQALSKIREERLYRSSHAGFEEYTRKRWGISRSQAYRLIDAWKIVINLRGAGLPLPTNERQTRPLNLLHPDIQKQVWKEAIETSPKAIPTAAHVAEVVVKYQNKAQPSCSKNQMSPNGGHSDLITIDTPLLRPPSSVEQSATILLPQSNISDTSGNKLTLSGWIQRALEAEGQCIHLKAHIDVLESKVKEFELLLQSLNLETHKPQEKQALRSC